MKNSKFIIQKSKLNGDVDLSGSKVSAITSVIASILTKEKLSLHNFPKSSTDVLLSINFIEKLGKKCTFNNNSLKINETTILKSKIEDYEESIRFTPLILAAILIRNGKGKVPLPGGCEIGNRKIDVYNYIFRKFGATFYKKNRHLHGEVIKTLTPNKISLPICSTGGTLCSLIFAASIFGKSEIKNAHMRPETFDIINILMKMGANIELNNNKINVEGSILNGTNHTLINDIMEAFTYVIFACVTKGNVRIKNFPYNHLNIPMEIAKNAGANFIYKDKDLNICDGKFLPFNIQTGVYPNLQSDLQPLMGAFSVFAKGKSRIKDIRFSNRYQYASELEKLGAIISYDSSNHLIIEGVNELIGTDVIAKDIRCGAALIAAGLNAKGTTKINNAEQINRGYDSIHKKLNLLGCNIEFIP